MSGRGSARWPWGWSPSVGASYDVAPYTWSEASCRTSFIVVGVLFLGGFASAAAAFGTADPGRSGTWACIVFTCWSVAPLSSLLLRWRWAAGHSAGRRLPRIGAVAGALIGLVIALGPQALFHAQLATLWRSQFLAVLMLVEDLVAAGCVLFSVRLVMTPTVGTGPQCAAARVGALSNVLLVATAVGAMTLIGVWFVCALLLLNTGFME
jgi:hypothetical protein